MGRCADHTLQEDTCCTHVVRPWLVLSRGSATSMGRKFTFGAVASCCGQGGIFQEAAQVSLTDTEQLCSTAERYETCASHTVREDTCCIHVVLLWLLVSRRSPTSVGRKTSHGRVASCLKNNKCVSLWVSLQVHTADVPIRPLARTFAAYF
jgi:hypothetical protein